MTQAILADGIRDRHVYLLGKTRSGKTTFLQNLIIQEMHQNKGVGFIDPHGDAAEQLLKYVPHNRFADAIYFEPVQHPIGLNALHVQSEQEREIVADDLLITFRRLSDSWGERMDAIFRYSFYTLLAVPGSTFLDLHHLLADDLFRKNVVSRLSDHLLVHFWTHEYPKMPKESAQPILIRMSKFVLSPTLSSVLGTTEGVNMQDVMDQGKILIVNLGRLGQDSATILGSIIVSQIQLAAMRRAPIPKSERRPFYLYVDEFQNFAGAAFQKILSEAGKFGLCLALANQYEKQIDQKMRDAITGNIGTLIVFKPGYRAEVTCLDRVYNITTRPLPQPTGPAYQPPVAQRNSGEPDANYDVGPSPPPE